MGRTTLTQSCENIIREEEALRHRIPTCVHREEPGNGVELWNEANGVQVVEELRVVEGNHVGELGEVLLDHRTVVPQEELVKVLVDEAGKTGVGEGCGRED